MASKNFLFNFVNTIILEIFSFILFFTTPVISLSFKYPTAFTLKDQKIFVIHSLGIDICDPEFTTSTNILSFSNQMEESELSMISTSKYPTGEFIVFIINQILVFDEYGNNLIITPEINNIHGEYYTLSAHKITHNNNMDYYYFLFGYIDISNNERFNLKLNYYYTDTYSKAITTIDSKVLNYNFNYNGLSCEFVPYNSIEHIICIYENSPFYGQNDYCVVSIFKINSNNLLSSLKDINFYLKKIEYIKSTINSMNSKPFFCGLNVDGKSFCLIYDLNYYYTNPSSNDNSYIIWDDQNEKNCIKIPYNIKTYYFQETGEYVFSCLNVDNEIQTTIYDKDLSLIEYIKHPKARLKNIFQECEQFNYSIIYSQIYKKYYVIADIDCDSYKQFFPLIEEEIDEIEEEEEKENIKEIFEEEKFKEKIFFEEEVKEEFIFKEEEEKEIEINDYLEEEKILEGIKENETEEKIIEEEKEKEFEELKEKEKEVFFCILEKCRECTEESLVLNLCIKCNIEKGYYPLNTGKNLPENFINCYNESTKPEGFYLDKENSEYKLCYSECKTCNFGGDGNQNNCTSCKNNQILKPDIVNSTNCVPKCDYFYYYKGKQYKCNNSENCPDNYQYPQSPNSL